jgi:HK97 family phage prohead protease
MPKVVISPADFRAQVEAGGAPTGALLRASTVAPEMISDRVLRYKFSDPSVARDGNTIASDAWQLGPFLTNPVFLWAHDADEPPIGRVVEIGTSGAALVGDVEYAERDLYPFADTIYQMVRAGFISATSVGFMPLKWSFPTEKTRIGGVDFKQVELLEISQVPVPALPTALVEARHAGIDTAPVFEWAERVLDRGNMILVPRTELEAMRRAAKMPKLTRKPLVQTLKTVKRGLYEVADLAWLLMQLGWLEDSVEWEAAMEGDGSEIPARLTDALRTLGQILVDMTAEEVAEMLAEEDAEGGGEGTADVVVEMAKLPPARRALVGLAVLSRQVNEAKSKVTLELDLVPNAATRGVLDALARAGRVLSADNEAQLRQAVDLIGAVLSQVATEDPAPAVIEQSADIERQRAVARVRVLQLASPA